MRGILLLLALFAHPAVGTTATNAPPASEHVVLLHGLARTPRSMARMEAYFRAEGYTVWNLAYPSRAEPLATLAPRVRADITKRTSAAARVHVITHSMGGMVLRCLQADNPLPNLGRVVMLSPPSGGSEIVDRLGHLELFDWINGSAGSELGTATNALPARLPPVDFELGVITGDRTLNWINSFFLIPGPDDGKVAVTKARTEGMRDFRVVHVSHPFIMRDPGVLALCLDFIRTGAFPPP